MVKIRSHGHNLNNYKTHNAHNECLNFLKPNFLGKNFGYIMVNIDNEYHKFLVENFEVLDGHCTFDYYCKILELFKKTCSYVIEGGSCQAVYNNKIITYDCMRIYVPETEEYICPNVCIMENKIILDLQDITSKMKNILQNKVNLEEFNSNILTDIIKNIQKKN